jgi:RNA polymerase sigma factor (sigma-70 family)
MSRQLSTCEVEAEHSVLYPPDENGGYCFADAEGGDTRAWELLVQRYQPYLLRLAASYRIQEDAHDAVQTTFLRLLEHGAEIRRPEAVRYWLATVLRRECLSVVQRRRREQPIDVEAIDAMVGPPGEDVLDSALLSEEDARVVQEALGRLPTRQRELLTLLSDPETAGYRTVVERLDMPIGSIGPTRQRALSRLHGALAAMGYDACV